MMLSILVSTLCVVLTCVPFCAAGYPFQTMTIQVPNKAADPFLLEFHHTRYYGGCFEVMRQNYPYNTIVPFIQNFDLLITSCSVAWNNPITSSNQQSCAVVLANRNTTQHTIERVHIHTDYRHNKYFVDNILPYYVKRHRDTGAGIILHTGGGDSMTRQEIIDIFLKTPAIIRWVAEQSRAPDMIDHPKVLFLPTGICVRENAGQQGVNLRVAIAESVPAAGTTEASESPVDKGDAKRRAMQVVAKKADAVSKEAEEVQIPPYYTVPGAHNSPEYHRNIRQLLALTQQKNASHQITSVHHAHRMLKETMKHAKRWDERLDRVLLCFGEGGNEHRIKFMEHARSGKCPVCDFCNGSMPALELWRMYGHYKFILSPYGNGADCGRTWEIMLMGAVPVIEYWPGALGYERGGLSAVTVVNPDELTHHNVHQWNKKYPAGQVAEKLTYEYWRDRIFDESVIGNAV